MAINVDIDQLADIIEMLPKKVEKAVIRGLKSAAYKLEGMIPDAIKDTKPYPPINNSVLINSHQTTPTTTGAIVAMTAPHAPFMEYGTRPHFPPLAPLIDWAQQKGFADSPKEAKRIAMSIAIKISKEGIAPRHFMARALQELVDGEHIEKEIRHELEQISR